MQATGQLPDTLIHVLKPIQLASFLTGTYDSRSCSKPIGQAQPQNTRPTVMPVSTMTPNTSNGNTPRAMVNSSDSHAAATVA